MKKTVFGTILWTIILSLISVAFAFFGYSPASEFVNCMYEKKCDWISFEKNSYSFIEETTLYDNEFYKYDGLFLCAYYPYGFDIVLRKREEINNFNHRILFNQDDRKVIDNINIIYGALPEPTYDTEYYHPSLLISKKIADRLLTDEHPTYASLVGNLFYVAKNNEDISVIDIDVEWYNYNISRNNHPYKDNFDNGGHGSSMYMRAAYALNVISGIYESDVFPDEVCIACAHQPFSTGYLYQNFLYKVANDREADLAFANILFQKRTDGNHFYLNIKDTILLRYDQISLQNKKDSFKKTFNILIIIGATLFHLYLLMAFLSIKKNYEWLRKRHLISGLISLILCSAVYFITCASLSGAFTLYFSWTSLIFLLAILIVSNATRFLVIHLAERN